MSIFFIFISFFSPNIQVLLVGEILCGLSGKYNFSLITNVVIANSLISF